MADTVADTKEKISGTPEKKGAEKKVIEDVEEIDEDSKTSENGDTNGDSIHSVKENGTSDEKDSADDEKHENGDKLGENGHAKNGKSDDKDCDIEVIASKRKSGGDAPVGTPAEGASPEKKAKLAESVDVEANGDTEAAA